MRDSSDRSPDIAGELDHMDASIAPRRHNAPTPVPGNACTVAGFDDGTGISSESTSAAEPVQLPRTFGKYELIAELGRGGMGVVYKAKQAGLDRTVALKMILGASHGASDKRERFLREARAIAALDHPNLVPVYEFDSLDGHLYFTMAFIEGANLAEVVKSGSVSVVEAARLMHGVAEGVAFVHRLGILHRDLKPQNILIDPRHRPRIMDFGLACFLSGTEAALAKGLTLDGTMMGTPGYMAPEQVLGKNIGMPADVHGLGAVLYHMLTGKPPFLGDTLYGILDRHLNEAPRPPSSINPAVPRDLEAICLSCLLKDPDQRPTAQTLVEVLEGWLMANGDPVKAWDSAPRAVVKPAPSASAATVDGWIPPPELQAQLQPQPQSHARRRPWLWPVAMAILAVVGVVGVAAILYRQFGSQSGAAVQVASNEKEKASPSTDISAVTLPTRSPANKGNEPTPREEPTVAEKLVFPPPRAYQDFELKVELLHLRNGELLSCPTICGVTILREGEAVLRITTARQASVGVFSVNGRAKVYMLLPNQFERNNLFEANEVHEIPPRGNRENYSFRLSQSSGVEQLRVLATTQEWPDLKGNQEGPFMAFREAELKGLPRLRDLSVASKNSGFAEVMLPFVVVKANKSND